MNGPIVIGGLVLVALLIAALVEVAHTRALLRRTQRERNVWGDPGDWRCHCGRLRVDGRSRLSDHRGMVHARRSCEPDLEAL